MHYVVVRGSLSDVLGGTYSLYCLLRETWFTDRTLYENMIPLDNKIMSWGVKKP